jgi:hypothetical protein
MNAWEYDKQGEDNAKFIKSIYDAMVILKECHKKLQELQWKEQGKVEVQVTDGETKLKMAHI